MQIILIKLLKNNMSGRQEVRWGIIIKAEWKVHGIHY